MEDVVKKKKLQVELESIDLIEPVTIHKPKEKSNGMVTVPEGYTVNCRSLPSGQGALVTTLKHGDKCNFDGRSRVGDYTWLHDVKGYWIRADQVECDGMELLKTT